MPAKTLRSLPILALLALGACTDPAAEHLGGFGDSVRGAALHAPFILGDTALLAGQPARAARAAVQMEVLAQGFAANPIYTADASGSVLHATALGRAEMRRALGIAPDAPADLVIDTLRDAAAALDAGSPARAEAALSGPAYPAGAAATLARLNRLPYLPRVAEAAGAAWQEVRRRDGFGRRG